MPNTIITPNTVANGVLMSARNHLVMGNLVNKDWETEFKTGGVKKGSVINIRKPMRFRAVEGATRQGQTLTDDTTPLVVDQQWHVSWSWSQILKTLSIDKAQERYFEPAGRALAQKIDAYLLSLTKYIPNAVGAARTTPATFATIAAAGQRLDDLGVNDPGRFLVLNPAANWSLIDAVLRPLYSPEIVGQAVKEGRIGKIMGNFDIYKSQNVTTHTPGADLTTVTVNGSNQTGSTLVVAGADLTAGERFTIPAVYAVNPESGVSTGVLQQFITLAAGTTSLSIYPPIITSGAYQTVDSVPVTGVTLTFIGTTVLPYVENIAFTKDTFTLAMVPIEVPESAPFAKTITQDGISITVVKDFNIDTYEEIIRLDVLFGAKATLPDTGCVVLG